MKELFETLRESFAEPSQQLQTLTTLFRESEIQINERSDGGDTPLMCAARLNLHTSIIQLLLDQGADPNIINNAGDVPLLYVIAAKNITTIEALLEHGANPDWMGRRFPMPLLMHTICCGRFEIATLLLKYGANINCVDANGESILSHVIQDSKFETVSWLLDHGADVNFLDSSRLPPLLCSIEHSNNELRMTELLLQRGADVNAIIATGTTILMFAANYTMANQDVLTLLLQHGADANSIDNDGYTISLLAARLGRHNIVKFMLNQENPSGDPIVDINYSTDTGITLGSFYKTNAEMRKFLLERGLSPSNLLSIAGKTSVEIAIVNSDQSAHNDTTETFMLKLYHKGCKDSQIINDADTVEMYTAAWSHILHQLVRFEREDWPLTTSTMLYVFDRELPIGPEFKVALGRAAVGLVKSKLSLDYKSKTDAEKAALTVAIHNHSCEAALQLLELAIVNGNTATIGGERVTLKMLLALLTEYIVVHIDYPADLIPCIMQFADSSTAYTPNSPSCGHGVVMGAGLLLQGRPGFEDVHIDPEPTKEFDINNIPLYMPDAIGAQAFELLSLLLQYRFYVLYRDNGEYDQRMFAHLNCKIYQALEANGFGLERVSIECIATLSGLIIQRPKKSGDSTLPTLPKDVYHRIFHVQDKLDSDHGADHMESPPLPSLFGVIEEEKNVELSGWSSDSECE